MSTPADGQPGPTPAMKSPATPPPVPARRGPSAAKHAQALSALQRLAKPQPRATAGDGENSPEAEDVGGPGSASGFVGMLAKRQIGEADFHAIEGKSPDEARAVPPAKYPLQMAREVLPEKSGSQNAPGAPLPEASSEEPAEEENLTQAVAAAGAAVRPRKAAAEIPARYRMMVPLTIALAALLLAIGCWAAGAVMYMKNVTPQFAEEVHYPLIAWSLDVGNMGGYTQGSQMMAWSMLACLPVALGLLVMAEMVRRRNGRDRRRARGQ